MRDNEMVEKARISSYGSGPYPTEEREVEDDSKMVKEGLDEAQEVR